MSALSQDASASAPPSEPVLVLTRRAITKEPEMTVYLISLALAGLLAIALWEAMS
jgi:hypothetical protein